MIPASVFFQIKQYVKGSKIDVQSQFDGYGMLMHNIKILDDRALYCVAYSDLNVGEVLIKEKFIEQLVEEFKAGKQMPF